MSEQERGRTNQFAAMVLSGSLGALLGAVHFGLQGNPVAGPFGAIGLMGLASLLPPGGEK